MLSERFRCWCVRVNRTTANCMTLPRSWYAAASCLACPPRRQSPTPEPRLKSGAAAAPPLDHCALNLDQPDDDWRAICANPVRFGDSMVEIGHDFAYGLLVGHICERLLKHVDLLAECQRRRQRKR